MLRPGALPDVGHVLLVELASGRRTAPELAAHRLCPMMNISGLCTGLIAKDLQPEGRGERWARQQQARSSTPSWRMALSQGLGKES